MSDSEDASVQGIEDALARLSLSMSSFNQSKHNGVKNQPTGEQKAIDGESLQTICSDYAQSVEWSTGGSPFPGLLDQETNQHFPKITNLDLRKRLNALHELFSFITEHPYSVDLYSRIARAYENVGYPDLAAGAAYKALLLLDNLGDEDNEFYDVAFISLAESVSKESLPSRCEALAKHPDLQKSLFHPDHARKDEDGYPTFPVLQEEVLVWAQENFAREV